MFTDFIVVDRGSETQLQVSENLNFIIAQRKHGLLIKNMESCFYTYPVSVMYYYIYFIHND